MQESNPTSEPVPPTRKPVTQLPTIKPITILPTPKPVTKSPSQNPALSLKPVTKYPTSKPVTQSPTVKPTVIKTQNPTTITPTRKLETQLPTQKPVTQLPTLKPLPPTPIPVTLLPTPKPLPPTQKPVTQLPTPKPLSPTKRPVPPTKLPISTGGLPALVDWTLSPPYVGYNGPVGPYLNAVQDQGGCGSCWAFSSTALLETAVYLKTGTLYKVLITVILIYSLCILEIYLFSFRNSFLLLVMLMREDAMVCFFL